MLLLLLWKSFIFVTGQLLKHMGHLSEKLPGCTGLPPQKGPQNTNVGTVISVMLVWKICIAWIVLYESEKQRNPETHTFLLYIN